MKKKPNWVWPNGKRIAVVFNVCLEAWSDGKAPGISPMGNPLPAGVLDTMAISWAAYGVEVGIHRLMDGFARHGAKASVMVNAIIAERSPETVKAIADRGHEVLSHSYAMDVIPALLSDEDERKNIERCTSAARKGVGPKDRRLAVAARHLEADYAQAARRGRLSLVWRCVRHRPALRREPRQQEDRRHSAVLRRQRHAVDEIRPSAAHDAGIVQRGDRDRARPRRRASHHRRHQPRPYLRPPSRRAFL